MLYCTCGHLAKAHVFLNSYGMKDQCKKCSSIDYNSYNWLHNFKADNLKYLERKAEEYERSIR